MTDPSRKYLFLVNPNAGIGKSVLAERIIRNHFRHRTENYLLKRTEGSGHAKQLIDQNLANGYNVIVAVGGDGTVNEIAERLIHSDIPLGIIPTGSGNGLARHLGISTKIKKALHTIEKGSVHKIDTATLNGEIFLNVAGIGMDAQVSKLFDSLPHRGWLGYLRMILRVTSKPEVLNLEVKSEKTNAKIKALMISFANSSQYGNNARIAPDADIRDGLIDVCILKETSHMNLMHFCYLVMKGKVKPMDYFETWKTSKIEVSGSNGLAHVDGDAFETGDEIKVEVKKHSLTIISNNEKE